MNLRKAGISEKEESLWLLAAMAVPLTQTASGSSWLSLLVVGALCLGIRAGIADLGQSGEKPRWAEILGLLWMALILARILTWTTYCWEGETAAYGVPFVLLALSGWAAWKGKSCSAAAGNGMRFFLILLLGAVLLSGIKDIRIGNLKPKWSLQSADLILVFLFPLLSNESASGKRIKKDVQLLAYGVIVAAITSGVLGLGEKERVPSAFYELSKSASLLGTAKRFESLAASAMTIGYFITMNHLLIAAVGDVQRGKRIIGISILAYGVYLMRIPLDTRFLALGSLLLWACLPIFVITKNWLQKISKNA